MLATRISLLKISFLSGTIPKCLVLQVFSLFSDPSLMLRRTKSFSHENMTHLSWKSFYFNRFYYFLLKIIFMGKTLEIAAEVDSFFLYKSEMSWMQKIELI